MYAKDYEIIARAIVVLPDRTSRNVVAHHLADVMQLENRRFNRTKFLVACDAKLLKRERKL